MATPSTNSADVEAIVNRANVALARSQRLIASWLPPRTAEEIANTKTEEELDKEDQQLFAPVPELLGLGAVIPKDGAERSIKRTELSSNERLRQQFLGKRAAADRKAREIPGATNGSIAHGSLTKPQRSSKPKLSESEDEEGRTSSIKSKRRKTDPERGKASGTFGRQKASATETGLGSARRERHRDPDFEGDEDRQNQGSENADTANYAERKVDSSAEQKPLIANNNYSNGNVGGESGKKKKKKHKHKHNHKHSSNGDEQA